MLMGPLGCYLGFPSLRERLSLNSWCLGFEVRERLQVFITVLRGSVQKTYMKDALQRVVRFSLHCHQPPLSQCLSLHFLSLPTLGVR